MADETPEVHQNVFTDHVVVEIDADTMELQDSKSREVIATAHRAGPTDPWIISIERDASFSYTAPNRKDAYHAMIDYGPWGVYEGKAGFSTLVPHHLDVTP